MKIPSGQPYLRKPIWLKVPPPYARHSHGIRATLAGLQLHTICQEAACPNITECFASGTATFLIMGNICTRHCLYCNVAHGEPKALERQESGRLAEAVRDMNLKYAVITSVTRDDLPDGGAGFFAECINRLRRENPEIKTEVLIPDFQGNEAALDEVISAAPDVINHNMELGKSMFARLRPQGDYALSLNILRHVSRRGVIAKSGFMLGFGETNDDILSLMDDLASTGCARLTIGQYQQPSLKHWPVAKYYHPEEFVELKEIAYQKGFQHVESGPLVRSSYRASCEV